MSTKTTNTKIQSSYSKNNQVRSKLLLFIDNEIQFKIKQNSQNLKFTFEHEPQTRISFEEIFIQKQTDKYEFPSSNIIKIKKNDNSDKSFSTIDDSWNKVGERNQKKRDSTHSKSINKLVNYPNKSTNDVICYKKKIYSIKNLSRHSITFLTLSNCKKGAEYLKNLCNSLKICKNNKKPIKHLRSVNINTNLLNLDNSKNVTKNPNEDKNQKSKNKYLYSFSSNKKTQKGNFVVNSVDKKPIKHIRSISINKIKLFDLNNDKKPQKKSNGCKKRKSNKDNLNTLSLFGKPQKLNFVINSKKRISRKSTNSFFLTVK